MLRRIILSLNGRALHVYVEGDCDVVELGRQGLSPMHRDSRVTITDTAKVRTPAGAEVDAQAEVEADLSYDLRIVEVETL